MASTGQQVYYKKRRDMNYASTRRIYFFHQTFYQFLFMIHQCNKILSSKLPNFTEKLTIHEEKKSLLSAMTAKQCKLSILCCHYYTFLSE